MNRYVQVSRVFDVPVQELWKMWTEPEFVMKWWGPDKFTCPLAEINFAETSTSLVCMKAPPEYGGQSSYCIWTYTKIVPYQLIEYIQNLANEKGVKQAPTDVGMPADFPQDVKTVVRFRAIDQNTTEMIVTECADFGQTSYFAQRGLEQCCPRLQKSITSHEGSFHPATLSSK